MAGQKCTLVMLQVRSWQRQVQTSHVGINSLKVAVELGVEGDLRRDKSDTLLTTSLSQTTQTCSCSLPMTPAPAITTYNGLFLAFGPGTQCHRGHMSFAVGQLWVQVPAWPLVKLHCVDPTLVWKDGCDFPLPYRASMRIHLNSHLPEPLGHQQPSS